MKKLNVEDINKAIELAESSSYFDNLYKIYNEIPQGNCIGCTNCCMESVQTHFIEFLNIFNYLKNNQVIYKELLPKIIRYYFLEMVTKEKCPFLDEKGRCHIYMQRPLVCRSFGHLSKQEYEEKYKDVLNYNIENMLFFKKYYNIELPKEVVNYKIEYCKNFEVNRPITKNQRLDIIDNIFTIESAFFMRGLITEEFIGTGLVSWFVYTVFDVEEAGKLRIKVMEEYLKEESSKTLEDLINTTLQVID